MKDNDEPQMCPMCHGTGKVTGRQYLAWQDAIIGWCEARWRETARGMRKRIDQTMKVIEKEYRDA